METNQPKEAPQRVLTKPWLAVGLVLLLAVMVPLGLYCVSEFAFGGGMSAASAPLSAAQLPQAPVPEPQVHLATNNPNPNVNPGSRRTMDLLVVDAVTKQPIAGLRAEVTDQRGFSSRTGADGHVRIPLPAQDHPDFFNFRVRGKNYVPIRMYWTTDEPARNDGIFPAAFTMEMEHGTRIGGKVVDESGKPVVGAIITLHFSKHFANPHQEIAAILGYDNRTNPTKSDNQGNWSFQGAPTNCDEIDISVADRRQSARDQNATQPFTPVSNLYDGTAILTLHH
jgi:hypothetical protein